MDKARQSEAEGRDVAAEVSAVVRRARDAQQRFAGFTQEQVDETVTALAWSIVEESNNHALSLLAVRETGLGKVADKMVKNRRKTLGLLRDLSRARTIGVIGEDPRRGITEIGRPVGVVGAIVPSTNPVATPVNKTLNALKCANAIVLAPSPKGQVVCEQVVKLMRGELRRVGAPEDLIQCLPAPVSKDSTQELMRQVDLVVATGSQSNVRAAYRSGTPAIGVGAGNVPVIVDDTADTEAAAAKIAASKAFDNATSCSSENSLIVVDSVFQPLLEALAAQGGVLLDDNEKQSLQRVMWVGGRLNREIVAQTASVIARLAELGREEMNDATFLMVEEQGIGEQFPFSDEKLSPVLTVYRVPDFEAAVDTARRILEFKGAGHSVGLYSTDEDRALQLGLELPVCRVIVNQAHCFATGGSFDNGLPFSLSMGCGSWGGNSISDNLNYKHFMNTTRIARTIAPDEPAEAELFGSFWAKYGLGPHRS